MAGKPKYERPERDHLIRLLEEHGSYQRAAHAFGVSSHTFGRWCRSVDPPIPSMSKFTPGDRRRSYPTTAVETIVREVDPDEVRALRRALERKTAEAKALRVEVRDAARTENLRDDILDLLRPVAASLAFPPPPTAGTRVDRRDRKRSPVELVVHLCDVHFGEIVDPETVQRANAYSPGIAARRIQHVVDTIRTYAADQPGGVSRIVLAVIGDTASGQHILHPDSATEYARIAKQVLDAAAIVAQVAIDLSDLADEVLIIGSQGNHGRSTRKMPTGTARIETSWETLLHELVAAFTRRVPSITTRIGRAYTVTEKIGPTVWAFSHGDATAGGGGSLGIPAYGLKRKHDSNREWSLVIAELTQAAVADAVVRHSRSAHFHTYFSWQAGHGDIALCPSIKGIDSYVLDKLGRYSPAGCLLEVVHPEQDVTGQHVIRVQHIVDESAPCRYVWGALETDAPTVALVDEWIDNR